MEPRLYVPLRQALGSLYSLQSSPNADAAASPQHHHHPSHAQAHEFLLHIQSRNARRKILSIQQRHRDQLQRTNNNNNHAAGAGGADSSNKAPPEVVQMGSSWLACLCLLLRRHDDNDAVSFPEKLFAAQSLLHRLRRNKLEDAIDLEIEQHQDVDHVGALELYSDSTDNVMLSVLRAYLHVVEAWNPFLGRVLAAANMHGINATSSCTEAQWKGRVTLLTLASILYMNATEAVADEHHNHSMPLLTTLASAIATVALRLLGDSNEEENLGFVPAILEAFHLIRHTADYSSSTANHHQQQHSAAHITLAYHASLQVTLAAVPESLLGSPDGQKSKGRLSLHPNALRNAYADLRENGFAQVRNLIVTQQHEESSQHRSLWWSLRTLECWSRFLPLPVEMWELSLPIVHACLKDERHEYMKSAQSYLLAIWEGAACTEDDVLALSLGLTSEKMIQQQGKKRQSSRSKKRHKELLDMRSDDTSLEQARQDVLLRGRVGCMAAASTWESLIPHFQAAMELANQHHQIDGEGPIGCLAAAAQACLPYMLRNATSRSSDEANLFAALAEALQRICASRNPLVRVLALEPVYKLHEEVLNEIRGGATLDSNLEGLLVDHFYHCCMCLAGSCGYPSHYFDDFSAQYYEELEVYRNDVRDVLRSISGSEDGGSTANVVASPPLPFAQKVLHKLLKAILGAIMESRSAHRLPEETVVHAFTALAKPINHQAQSIDELGGQNLEIALQCLVYSAESVLSAMEHNGEAKVVLPIARTLIIGAASLSPMLSKVDVALQHSADKSQQIRDILQLVLRVALTSIEQFPELAATSDPGHIEPRGAMRGPGGEDHVACVALMRLSTDSENLGNLMAETVRPFLPRICEIYQRLKMQEIERGAHLLTIQGTTPKSRRILLGVLCRIETISQSGASSVLQEIFHSAVASIAAQSQAPLDHSSLLTLCEATYDLSAFPPNVVSSLFEAGDQNDICHRVLVDACCRGYAHPSSLAVSEENLKQWNRLRAAIFTLVKGTGVPDVPGKVGQMVLAWTRSECEAIRNQCSRGPSCDSDIFAGDLVCEDGVPAGIFLRAIQMILQDAKVPLRHCLNVLIECRETVLTALVHPCPDPVGFVDPRCTLAEAWFLSMSNVVGLVKQHEMRDSHIDNLLYDTFCAAVQLIFYPSLGKTLEERRRDPGMTLDGAHTLFMCDFLADFFQLGLSYLQAVSEMVGQMIPVECPTDLPSGLVIIAAALFRSIQGSLPPWAVESVPQIYSAFYAALGKDVSLFVRVLASAMEVRLRGVAQYGGVSDGQILSGRYFEGVSVKFRESFLEQIQEICQADTPGGWKKMKQVIKAACGGKKKESDFKQKPAPTRWEVDRF